MSKIFVDQVDPKTATTLTLGTSGDTVSIPSGVTIANSGTATGFGTTLSGSTNNTVATVTGANALIGEANLTFDGTDLTVSTGNLVVGTAGKGIDFSAQTPTSATGATTGSELLDHYEEGTWTGVITDGTNDATMDRNTCNYTRIGSVVIFSGQVTTTSLGSVSGDITLKGLPFVNKDDYQDRAGVAFGYGTNLALGTAGYNLAGHVQNDTSYIYLSIWNQTYGTSVLTSTLWSSDGATIFSGSYVAA